MRLARPALQCALATLALMSASCGAALATTAAAPSAPPPCASTFIAAITSPDPTPGVWDCLSRNYQNRLQGQGDNVFAITIPLWTHPRYIGQDKNIVLFDLIVNGRVEPAVYNPPVTHVVMAVYVDGQGHVDHAKSATPTG